MERSSAGDRASRAAPILWVLLAGVGSGCVQSPVRRPEAGKVVGKYDTCEHPEGMRLLADANRSLAAGSPAAALEALKAARAHCPDLVPLHLQLIDLAEGFGGSIRQRVEDEYRNLPDDGRRPLPPYLKARVAVDDKSRLQLLDQAIERDARFHHAHAAKGRVLAQLERFDQAVACFQAALAAEPAFHEVSPDLGFALVRLGRTSEAERQFAAYIRIAPRDRVVLRELAQLLIYSLDRARDARPYVEQLMELDGESVPNLMDLAAVEWSTGNLDQARQLYHRVLSLDPGASRAVLNLGNLWYEAYAGAKNADRRQVLAKARSAYRYYLAMRQAEEGLDLFDLHLTVPFRLKTLERELGPAETPAKLSDF